MNGRRELWTVPNDNVGEAVVLHPLNSERTVNLWPEIDREEPVAVQPTRGHQDEDSEGGVTEPKALRQRLGEEADCGVNQFQVALIYQ